jgi:hypothetical protein
MRHRHRRLISTPAILLAVSGALLTASPAAALQKVQTRPDLPSEATFGSSHFLVHYTLSGDAAVDPADANGNGAPDFVEQVDAAAEFVWQKEVVDMGWAAPPKDRGEGGDDRVDIYLENLLPNDVAGYTESEGGFVGDNPNTPQRERHAAYSYLSIDNDFSEIDSSAGETPVQVMKATLAHEFNHVLQAGYDDFDPQTWLYEATATWMEAEVYPDITDSQSYLPDILDHPEVCRAAKAGWYGSWLFMQHISEQYGAQTVRTIWEHSGQVDGDQAIDQTLTPLHSSLVAESQDFAIANLLRAYRDGGSYPTVRLGGELDGPGTFTPISGVQSLGATYVQLVGRGPATVSFAGTKTLTARVVGVRAGQADVFDFVDGRAEVDLSHYDRTYAVVHDDELAISEDACPARDFSVSLSAPKGPVSPVAVKWLATNFAPLSTASGGSLGGTKLHPSFDGGGSIAAQSPSDLKVAFQTIVPTPPPDGYYFDYTTIMTPQDFGASASDYIPQGDQAADFDYLDSNGNWLSITESPVTYKSLQEWEDAIQYQPSTDTQTINDVEVLIEDTSSGSRQQTSATLIYQGLFIVVDGDGPPTDVTAMVLAIIMARQVPAPAQGGTQSALPGLNQPTLAAIASGTPSSDVSSGVMILGAISACGLGICLAGAGLAIVVIITRRRVKSG